jgi:hypothetical protein
MGFFNKKEERKELPELPGMSKLPELPPLPSLAPRSEINPLPAFSRNEFSSSSDIGMQAIKTTIREGSERGLEYMPKDEDDDRRRVIEVSDKETIRAAMAPRTVSKEPVFIKIDKFKEAVEKFREIKEKVTDIEDSLKKLKEVKDKEDLELKAWDQEMQLIRQKVEIIDNSLFNKI